MGINPRPVKDPSKVVKIECLDLPERREKHEGYYRLRWAHKPKDIEFHDIISLGMALKSIMPDRAEDILDRLQNFRIAYLNLATGEISS
jgi:hypothetical protein